MGIRDRLRRPEKATEGETVVARCERCGEEMRIREGILLDVSCLEWQTHRDGTNELPADTDPDIRWVWEHPCDALLLRVKASGESVFGHVWERGDAGERGGRWDLEMKHDDLVLATALVYWSMSYKFRQRALRLIR